MGGRGFQFRGSEMGLQILSRGRMGFCPATGGKGPRGPGPEARAVTVRLMVRKRRFLAASAVGCWTAMSPRSCGEWISTWGGNITGPLISTKRKVHSYHYFHKQSNPSEGFEARKEVRI